MPVIFIILLSSPARINRPGKVFPPPGNYEAKYSFLFFLSDSILHLFILFCEAGWQMATKKKGTFLPLRIYNNTFFIFVTKDSFLFNRIDFRYAVFL